MNKIISIKLEKEKLLRKKYSNNTYHFSDISNSNNTTFNLDNQKYFINNLYLNNDFREKKELISILNAKINNYKQQDIKKKINNNDLINLNQLIEKLVISKLLCFYCKKKVYLFYLNVREKLQWTLDRIDNNKNHSNDNTIICCLECNLKRRTRSKEHFLFTKQLIINKS